MGLVEDSGAHMRERGKGKGFGVVSGANCVVQKTQR